MGILPIAPGEWGQAPTLECVYKKVRRVFEHLNTMKQRRFFSGEITSAHATMLFFLLSFLFGAVTAGVQVGTAGHALEFDGFRNTFSRVTSVCFENRFMLSSGFSVDFWMNVYEAPNMAKGNDLGMTFINSGISNIMGNGYEKGISLRVGTNNGINSFFVVNLFQTECHPVFVIPHPWDSFRHRWQHVSVHYNVSHAWVWLNGEPLLNFNTLTPETPCGLRPMEVTNDFWIFGGDEQTVQPADNLISDGFFGALDEIKLYKHPRSVAAVRSTMFRSLTQSEREDSELVLYQTFEETTGASSLVDSRAEGDMPMTLGDGLRLYTPRRIPSGAPVVTLNHTDAVTLTVHEAGPLSAPPFHWSVATWDPQTETRSSQNYTLVGLPMSALFTVSLPDGETALTPDMLPLTLSLEQGLWVRHMPTANQTAEDLLTVVGPGQTAFNVTLKVIPNRVPTAGNSGQALLCDGVDDYYFADSFTYSRQEGQTKPVTVEFWARSNREDATDGVLFSVGDSEIYFLCVEGSGSLTHGVTGLCHGRFISHFPFQREVIFDYGWRPARGLFLGRAQRSMNPFFNQWAHVALVSEGKEGGTMTIYINGEAFTTSQAYPFPYGFPNETHAATVHGLTLCRYIPESSYHRGAIDEFKLWGKAFTSAEIQEAYSQQRPLTGSPEELLVYYDFDHLHQGPDTPYFIDQSNSGHTLIPRGCTSHHDALEGGYIGKCLMKNTGIRDKDPQVQVVPSGVRRGTTVYDQHFAPGESTLNLRLNGTDFEGSALYFILDSLPQYTNLTTREGGALPLQLPQASSRLRAGRPRTVGGAPYDQFTYRVTDGVHLSEPATVTLWAKCPPGTFNLPTPDCTPCPPGSYQDVFSNDPVCKLCPLGTAQASGGQEACRPCEEGTSTDRTRSGSHAPVMGLQQCRPCSGNTYASGPGAITCTQRDTWEALQATVGVGGIVALLLTLLVLIIVFITAAVWATLRHQRKKKWKEFVEHQPWRVHYKDLMFMQKRMATSRSLTSIRTANTGNTDASRTSSLGMGAKSWHKTATYNNTLVYVKEIPSHQSIPLDESVLNDILHRSELFHPNLVRFIGLSIDAPNVCVLLEYTRKGSLQDILYTEVELDTILLYMLISGITAGMEYLHKSPLKMHGNLKSSNVLIDDSWNIKLSDFGLTTVRNIAANSLPKDEDSELSEEVYKELLWQSPQRLRDSKPSAPDDVYAWGIIVQEIFTRDRPFADITLTYKELCEKLREEEVLPTCTDTMPDDLKSLVKACWNKDETQRPGATDVMTSFKKANPHGNLSITDLQMKILKKYSSQLEDMVAERTQELESEKANLVVEKERNFDIICSMVPRSIAEKLRDGVTIAPERFAEASLYFSDVCSFTTISSTLEPQSVITMLQHMFQAYDTILKEEAIYKVETIGDAYVAASGLPERWENHAERILRFGCRVMTFMKDSFTPPEGLRQDLRPIRIRIGMHTGPIVAGVIGTEQNPRYNLFGDTMNTASRMESTSEPGRIQCSEPFYHLVRNCDVADFELRGEIEVKGKGTMRTYWVTPKRT